MGDYCALLRLYIMFEFFWLPFLLVSTSALSCDGSVCLCSGDTCSSCLLSFQYLEGNVCQPCPYMCKSCSSGTLCFKCYASFFLEGGTCTLCPSNCETCGAGQVCSSCLAGYYLSQGVCQLCSSDYVETCDSGDMVVSCLAGYWQNGNSCSPCREFCLICSSPSNCLQCQEGYYVAIGFGSYCAKCPSGCQTCSASGCTQCFLNYVLQNGGCSSITANCTTISNCDKCTSSNNAVTCYSCKYPYFVQRGACRKGSSLICPLGAVGPMYYQCLNGCGSNGYAAASSNGVLACLPRQWLPNYKQLYLNAFDWSFIGKRYSTSLQTVYLQPQGLISNSVLTLPFALDPYFKLVLQLKLIADLPLLTPATLNISLTDNSSNLDQTTASFTTDSSPYPFYCTFTSKTVKDQSVTLSISASTALVGLSELLMQVYPCPPNCRICYNSELCIECKPQFFNTPEYLCLQNCSGYLQLYMPSGNLTNYLYKECVLTCPNGFFSALVDSVYRCQKCLALCLTCLSQTQCLSCQAPFLFSEIDFQCLTACPNTHYNFSSICQLCLAPCKFCTDATTCLSCSTGSFYNGSCLASCPQGTFANAIAGSCDLCAAECLSCEGSASYCLACLPPYLLFESACLLACPSALYYEAGSACLTCLSPCLSCSSSSACLSCQLGYLYLTACVTSCLEGYYSDALTSTCKVCASNCLTCESESICSSCSSPLNLYSYSCVAACPLGTYSSNRLCVSCLQPCSTCSNSTYCFSCSIGFLSSLAPGTCLSACEDGYYSSLSSSACLKCAPNCLTCSSSQSSCTSCSSGLMLEGASCVSVCSAGSYNLTGNCMDCSFPCFQCSGNDYTCLSCQEGYILVTNVCLVQCPIYTYLNQGQCLPCPPPCLTCTSPTDCSSCLPLSDPAQQTYFSNGQCLLQCPSGFFRDSNALVCRECSYPCLSCSSETVCLSCQSGYLNLDSRLCQYCSGVYFSNETSRQCQLCSSVLSNCLECLSSSECSLCTNLTVLFNWACVSTDACLTHTGYYVDSSQMSCSPCLSPCQTCINASYCLSCSSGLVLSGTCLGLCPSGWFELNATCFTCSATCKTCLNASMQGCLSCDSAGPFPVYLQSKYECIVESSCGEGFYIDSSYGWKLCEVCPSPCRTCTNASYCLTCSTGFWFGGSCKTICPSGFYEDLSNSSDAKCLSCSAGCSKCSLVSTNCTSCPLSLYLKKGSCVSVCGEGYYLDSYIYECFQCVQPCFNCSSASVCLSCLNTTYLLYESQCMLNCPSGTYKNITIATCMSCPASCLTCTSSTSGLLCLQCVSGLFMSANTPGLCLSSCGALSYGGLVTLKCYSCISPCVECLSAIQCKSCVDNYLLVGSQCLSISRCPSGRFLSGRECVLSCGSSLWANEESASCEGECPVPLLKVAQSDGLYCVKECWSGYKVDLNYTCLKCIGENCLDLLKVQVQGKSIFNCLFLKISFSAEVRLSSLSPSDLVITSNSISARLLPESLSYSVSTTHLDAVWLKITTASSLAQAIITVTFMDYYLVGTPLQQLSYNSSLLSFDLYSPQTEEQANKFQSFSQTMSLIMLIIFLANLALNSGHLSYLIIDSYQLFFMLLFLGIDYPPHLNHFLYGFRYSHYLFLPQIFRGNPEQEYSSATPDKFGVIVPDVYFLNNAGPSFIIIGIAFATLLGCKALQNCVKKIQMCRSNRVGVSESKETSEKKEEGGEKGEPKKREEEREEGKEGASQTDLVDEENRGRCGRLLQAVTSRFKWNYFNDVIYSIYFSLMLFAFSQLYDLTWRPGTPSDIVSTLLAFVFILLGLSLPVGLAYFLHRQKDHLIYKTISRDRLEFEKKMKETEKPPFEEQSELIGSRNKEKNSQVAEHEEEEVAEDYEILTDFKCFVAGVRLRVRIGFYHIPLAYLKKLILACLIVFCSEYPSLVLGVTMMFYLIDVLIILVLRPFRLTFEQIIFPIFNFISILFLLIICIMQLPILSLPQSQKLTASILAISLCILFSVLVALHNIVMNVAEIVKYCCRVDWFQKYCQSDFLQNTTVEEEHSEPATELPLKKEPANKPEEEQEPNEKVQQPSEREGSMVSGLDIYLRKEKDVPKYLIKCVKPEGVIELKEVDIRLSEGEKSQQKSSSQNGEKEESQASNIFANIKTIEVYSSENND